jgi:hypothetical protein
VDRDADGRNYTLIMEVPVLRDSDDPVPIVGFEVERMIPPR